MHSWLCTDDALLARLPVTDFPPEWHTQLWQSCHDWVYQNEVEAQGDSRLVFPEIPQLGEVLNSTVVRGALSSLLGPDCKCISPGKRFCPGL